MNQTGNTSQGSGNGTSNGKITVRDIYDELFHCRDFELDHLWQRSVFLAAFLIAIATAYGSFVNEHFCHIFMEPCKPKAYQIACLGLCMLGIMFSQLWILMAKGSKWWYEKYEKSISWFYKRKCGNAIKNALFDSSVLNGQSVSKNIPRFGRLWEFPHDDSLLSTKAGRYSVSRINCFIGIVFCGVWIVLAAVHLHFLLDDCLRVCQCKFFVWVFPAVFAITYSMISCCIAAQFTKSEA
ncbi:MAG: hypothetical protein J6K96_09720 [Treponema sp.]|nr:hypothetical protein [Treponema sp.]